MFSHLERHIEDEEVIENTVHPSHFEFSHLKWYLFALTSALIIGASIWYLRQRPDLLPEGARPIWLTAALIIPALALVFAELRRDFTFYHFTDRKIVEERGIFNKNFLTVHYGNITETRLEQVFYERIFGVGDLHINTAGTDAVEMILHGLRDPEHFKVKVSSKSSVAHMPHATQAPKAATLSEEALEAELGRIQRRRQELERKLVDQRISDAAYDREWYMLEGEERIIQHLLDELERR